MDFGGFWVVWRIGGVVAICLLVLVAGLVLFGFLGGVLRLAGWLPCGVDIIWFLGAVG